MSYSTSIADCYGAVEVLDYDNDARVQFPGNLGEQDDFLNSSTDFHEVNSVWLRLEPRVKGTFEFDIYTENNVDFAYMIFKANDNSFCEQLHQDKIMPLQSEMHSYHAKGASDQGGDGKFKPSIKTEVSDVFYLMIHTNSTYEGKVRVNFRRMGEIERTLAILQDFRSSQGKGHSVRVKIRDAETNEPVESNLIIKGLNRDNDLFLGTDFLFTANFDKELYIESNTQGYFLFSKTMSTEDLMGKDVEIVIELDRLGPGKKLELQDIKFEQDSDNFIKASMPALKRLLDFLALNDDIRVSIQGHVNAPDSKNTSRIQNLSESRAKAVRKFLKDNGISPERMEVLGFGNTQMKYPEPKELWQEEANRRVEIVIID